MSATKLVNGLADTARAAARTLSAATGAERAGALNAIADAILARSAEIIAANEEDMVRARAAKINDSLLDRLLLTHERVEGIANGARLVSKLPDPLGITLRHSTLPNGIDLRQVTVPFGFWNFLSLSLKDFNKFSTDNFSLLFGIINTF